ncbi:MAG: hypothetical protein AAB513_00450 [Patescibacteria group bacterium]
MLDSLNKENILKWVFLTFAIITGVFIAFYIASYYEDKEQGNFLEKELKDFVSLPVAQEGKTYIIKNGKVFDNEKSIDSPESLPALRIAYTSILNRFEPIFALEGTDIEKLEKSVRNLESSLEIIISSSESDEGKIIKNAFYPIDFLKSLTETEEMRQKLIYEPTYEVATDYYQNLGTTIDAYTNYIINLENELEKISNISRNQPLHHFGGVSTPQNYIDALKEAKNNAESKKQELETRIKCLDIFSKECPSLKTAFENMTRAEEPTVFKKEDISQNVINNGKIISGYFKGLDPSGLEYNDEFPVIALQDSACFRDMPIVYYQPQWKFYDKENKAFRLNFLNDLYFFTVKNNIANFIAKMGANGLNYLYQPATNFYVCPVIIEDFSRIITADTIRAMPLSEVYTGQDNFKKLENGVFYESNAVKYVEDIKSNLRSQGENKLALSIGVDKVLSAEKIISISRQKSPRFDEILGSVIIDNAIITPAFIKEAKLNLHTLFLGRSYPMILLSLYNKSFIKEPPLFMEYEQNSPPLFRMVKLASYNEELKKTYSIENIIKEMLLGMKLTRLKYNL